MRWNLIQSTKIPENPDPFQSNTWMDQIHVQLWLLQHMNSKKLYNTTAVGK